MKKDANTPWAPAGTERIEFAYGNFPRRAMKGRRLLTGVCAVVSWCLTHSCSERDGFRCKNVTKKTFKTTKRKPKGNRNGANTSQGTF